MQVLSSATESIFLTTQSFSGDLEVNDTYSRSLDYTIPSELPNGIYNLSVYVDYYGQVFEHTYISNNMATREMRVTQLLPDLTLEDMNATISLDSQREQALLSLFWRVRNTGDGVPSRKEWVDRAYLSKSFEFPTRGATILGDVIHRVGDVDEDVLGFPPGRSYLATAMFTLAQGTFGDLYVHLKTDYRNAILEKNNELSNNVESINIEIPSRSSNLMTRSINIVKDGGNLANTEFYSGEVITVSWNVTNDGNWATNLAHWLDVVFISRVAEIDNAARRLVGIEHEGKLFPGDSYTQTVEFKLPDNLWGELYILVKTDNNDDLYQINDGSTKSFALQISLQVPPTPDLAITSLDYSLKSLTRRRKRQVQGSETRLLTISWVTKNAGNSMVQYLTWNDAIIISKERGNIKPPRGILLKTFSVTGNLRAGQRYEFTRTVVIPDNVDGGSFYVYVVPDYFRVLTFSNTDLETNTLFETDKLLDVMERARPDLEAVYSHGIPPEVESGQFVSLTFNGINAGGVTNTNSWIDAIYMSSNVESEATEPDASALLVHQVRHVGSLGYDRQYRVDAHFQIPYSVGGPHAIFVELDYLKSVDDVNGNNNIVRVPLEVNVIPALLPDLTVAVQEAFSLRSGEPFTLNFNISNHGQVAINQSIYNVVYLSEDVEINPFDIKIDNAELFLYLEVNTTRVVQLDLFMPFDIPSAGYYVMVHVDSRNDAYETDDSNNIDFTLSTIEESYSTDVAVIAVVPSPSSVTYGTDVTIQWTLRNNGSEDALGYKCDTAYFSEDSIWSIDDDEIDTQCGAVNLQPFNNDASHDISYSMSAPVPLITPRGYRTLVRSRSNIRDLNLENNVGVAQSVTDIDIDVLNLDDPKQVTLRINEEKVFRVPKLMAEETLIFQMISDTQTDFNEVYVRFGDTATTGFYDAAGVEFLSPHQNAVIGKSRAGDYYVLVRKKGTSSAEEQRSYLSTITLTAKYARLEILDVYPREAAPLGTVTLRISGTLFPEEVSVVLEDQQMNEIVSDAVYHFTSLEMYATFNITGMDVGSKFKLRVRDVYSDAIQTVFPDALAVIDGRPGTLNFRLDNPGRLPPLETGRIRLFVQNVGNSDLLTPILKLDLTGDATFKIVQAYQQSNSNTGYTAYAVPQRGPGGILPPGATSLVTFDITPNSFGTQSVRFRVTELQPSATIDNPYAKNKALFKLYEIDNRSWDRVWSNFMSATGSTLSSLSKQMSKTANQLSLIGHRIVDMEEMIRVQVKLADGFQSGNLLHSQTDLSIGSQDSGLHAAEVIRNYSPKLSHRNFVGVFGRGWSSPYL